MCKKSIEDTEHARLQFLNLIDSKDSSSINKALDILNSSWNKTIKNYTKKKSIGNGCKPFRRKEVPINESRRTSPYDPDLECNRVFLNKLDSNYLLSLYVS